MDPIAGAVVYVLVTSIMLGVLGAVAITGLIWLGWRLARRWGGRGAPMSDRPFLVKPAFACVLLLTLPAACIWAVRPVPQPASAQTVAALEVPLRTPTDRADLLALMRRHASGAGGLHVDSTTEPPGPTRTIYASVWRDADDTDLEILIDDEGHPGRAWLMFMRGEHPELASGLRVRLIGDLKGRWADVRDVPVMPNGALPAAEDLNWMGTSYVVKSDRVAAYSRTSR